VGTFVGLRRASPPGGRREGVAVSGDSDIAKFADPVRKAGSDEVDRIEVVIEEPDGRAVGRGRP